MMPIHAFVALAVAFVLGAVADRKVFNTAYARVKAEVAKMETEFKDALMYRERKIVLRVKSLL
jgi:hypothetical protein